MCQALEEGRCISSDEIAGMVETEMFPWTAAAPDMLIKEHRRIIMNPRWVKFQDRLDPKENNLGFELWTNEREIKEPSLKAYCSQRL